MIPFRGWGPKNSSHNGRKSQGITPQSAQPTQPAPPIPRRSRFVQLAFDVLQDYASDQPNVLANLLMDSEEAHFAVLFEKLKAHQQAVVPLLEEEMVKLLPALSQKTQNLRRLGKAS